MVDDVQLTDLEVIQRYSLAVRGATASREELVQALQADLAWLAGSSRRTRRAPAAPARTAPVRKAPARQAPAAKTAARKATPKRAARA